MNEDFPLDLFTLMRNRLRGFRRNRSLAGNRWNRGAIPRPRIADRAEVRFGTGKDRLDVAALREIIAGATLHGTPNLEELTPPANSRPDESR